MSAESRESFSSLDSEVMEVTAEGVEVMKVTAEGVANHGDGLDCKVKVEVKSAQNSADKVKEGKKNNAADVFDFSSCSDEFWKPGRPVNSEEGLKKEAVNERGGKKLVFANGSTGEKLDRRKLNKMRMKPFPLSGIQVFKQVMYGIVGIVSNYLQSLETNVGQWITPLPTVGVPACGDGLGHE